MRESGELGDTRVLAALLGISDIIGELEDLDEVLEAIVRITPQLVGVRRCAVLLREPQKREFRVAQVFSPDREKNALFQRIVLREEDITKLAHRILEEKLPAIVKDAEKEGMLPREVTSPLGLRGLLIAPLACRGRVVGILLLDDLGSVRFFTSKEINVVMGIASLVASAIELHELGEVAALERRRWQSTARALSDGVLVLDRDLRITGLNPGAESLLGWTADEVLGKPCSEVFAATDETGEVVCERGCVGKKLLWGAEPGEPRRLHFRRKDGTQVLLQVRGVAVKDADGQPAEIVYALQRVDPEETSDLDPRVRRVRRIEAAPSLP